MAHSKANDFKTKSVKKIKRIRPDLVTSFIKTSFEHSFVKAYLVIPN